MAVHLAATGARHIGASHIASALGRTRLLLRTSVAQRVEWLICTELLELPCHMANRVAVRDALAETIATEPLVLEALRAKLKAMGVPCYDRLDHLQIRRAVAEYAGSRAAASEIATGLLTLSTGALTLAS